MEKMSRNKLNAVTAAIELILKNVPMSAPEKSLLVGRAFAEFIPSMSDPEEYACPKCGEKYHVADYNGMNLCYCPDCDLFWRIDTGVSYVRDIEGEV